ncbi:MAG TPA: hypothetical protein VM141_07070 [Planctomycetota bacterium]|nr:hypothetical protein [Planctomycetota bacterium]
MIEHCLEADVSAANYRQGETGSVRRPLKRGVQPESLSTSGGMPRYSHESARESRAYVVIEAEVGPYAGKSSIIMPRKMVKAGSAEAEVQLAKRFKKLVREWHSKTAFAATIVDIATAPPYQMIIGMGPDAIPLILKELKKEPDHWFWALKAITGGEDPVPESDRGNMVKMRRAWINWGKKRRYDI